MSDVLAAQQSDLRLANLVQTESSGSMSDVLAAQQSDLRLANLVQTESSVF